MERIVAFVYKHYKYKNVKRISIINIKLSYTVATKEKKMQENAARLQENVCCRTRSGDHDASSLIFVIKLDLLCTLSMLEEVRRDSEVYWSQYSLRQVHAHIYTEMKPRTQLSE